MPKHRMGKFVSGKTDETVLKAMKNINFLELYKISKDDALKKLFKELDISSRLNQKKTQFKRIWTFNA